MAKIMLVEDDNSLVEIYQARLAAEGYEVVTARDGEQALALAVKEKPDLIVCDVMMPKVSGFEMIDILRSTAGIKDTKVIMMTALSQAEDKARAEKLGADRYLVKSQVTLEDMAKAVTEVLNGTNNSPENILSTAATTLGQASSQGPVPAPAGGTNPTMQTQPMAVVTPPSTQSISPDQKTPIINPPSKPENDGVAINRKRVIQPLNDPSVPVVNLDALLAKEAAKDQMTAAMNAATQPAPAPVPVVVTNNNDTPSDSGPTVPQPPTSTPPPFQAPGNMVAPEGPPSDPNSISI